VIDGAGGAVESRAGRDQPGRGVGAGAAGGHGVVGLAASVKPMGQVAAGERARMRYQWKALVRPCQSLSSSPACAGAGGNGHLELAGGEYELKGQIQYKIDFEI